MGNWLKGLFFDTRPDWLKGPPYKVTVPETATPIDLLHFISWYLPKIREIQKITYIHYLILEAWMSPEEHEACPFKEWFTK